MAEGRYAVVGDIDLDIAARLQSELLGLVNTTTDDLVLDCEGLQFIDSSGIAVFVNTQRVLALQHRALRIENLHGMPRRSFELLGLIDMLDVPDPDRA